MFVADHPAFIAAHLCRMIRPAEPETPLSGQCHAPRLIGMGMPETRYAPSGDVMVAYQVVGQGPFDVVIAPPWVSHVELVWETVGWATFLRGIAEHARVLVFDKRGTGLSDRVPGVPTLEERSDDIRAVMEAAGSDRAAVFGASESVPMSVVFAASHPERVSALVLYGGMARWLWAPDYLFGFTEREVRKSIEEEIEAFLTPGALGAFMRAAFRSGLPRVFRTTELVLFHAANCRFRYSSRASCGVR
jgi:pimeloyl-ACP methyl ester carboxylesterase